jgi:hypothetical protein
MKASLTAVARHFTFVRETQGANRGAWVQFFQRVAGGQPGDPWCCFFLCRVLDIAYFGHSPLIVTGSCAELLANVRAKGYDLKPSSAVQPDDIFFYLDANGQAHHVGIVTQVNPMKGLAGNTSEDGLSSEGVGVFEHPIAAGRMAFARLP